MKKTAATFFISREGKMNSKTKVDTVRRKLISSVLGAGVLGLTTPLDLFAAGGLSLPSTMALVELSVLIQDMTATHH